MPQSENKDKNKRNQVDNTMEQCLQGCEKKVLKTQPSCVLYVNYNNNYDDDNKVANSY